MWAKLTVLKEKVLGTLIVKLNRQMFLTFNFTVKIIFKIYCFF